MTGGLYSEHQKLPIRFSRDELRPAFVDRKPLLAGVLMHRFDCIKTCLIQNERYIGRFDSTIHMKHDLVN